MYPKQAESGAAAESLLLKPQPLASPHLRGHDRFDLHIILNKVKYPLLSKLTGTIRGSGEFVVLELVEHPLRAQTFLLPSVRRRHFELGGRIL